MVGDMRDPETASIALQASLTGHLVLTTLHTSNTVESITRLIDLGVEPWIVGNALQALVAQRLVRTLCHCSTQTQTESDIHMSADDRRVLLPKGSTVKQAAGCETCHDTGYKGRTAIFEVLDVDDDLRDLVKVQASTRAYREQVQKIGSRSLREAGIARVIEGVTTLEEVLRVT
jgi:general secretion pathway protein E/type IV pilus assembly protein PilB